MSKTRLSPIKSLYVIGDIHGMLPQLEVILKRILPLRKADQIVFLGDYIDRGNFSFEVIERLIKLQNDYPEQCIFLMGNHEFVFYNAIQPESLFDNYKIWMNNGGYETLTSYMGNSKIKDLDPWCVTRNRIIQLVPASHLDFINNLLPYYETDSCIFVHAGCDPYIALEDQDFNFFIYDRSLCKNLINNKAKQNWEKIIIAGHNGQYKKGPFISNKFWMIDGSRNETVYLFDAYNNDIYYAAEKNNKRLVKFKV